MLIQPGRDIMVRGRKWTPTAQALFREPMAKAAIPSPLLALGAVAELFTAFG